MAIFFPIPVKARFIPSSNIFSANFTGVYDFSLVAGNVKQTVIALDRNTVYYIDGFSIGGNITREDYLSAISTLPVMVLSRKNDGQQIYAAPIPLVQFYENHPANAFTTSDKSGDELQLSITTGILNQVSNLVGVNPVKLSVSFNIYAMDDREYNAAFRDSLDPQFSNRLRR